LCPRLMKKLRWRSTTSDTPRRKRHNMTAINGNNGNNGHNGTGRHNLHHAGNGNGANGNGHIHGMKDSLGTNGHNHTVPFLDLVTPHLQLEEELISTFKEALSTAAF